MNSNSSKPGFGWYLFLAIFSPLVVVELAQVAVLTAHSLKSFAWLGGGLLLYVVINNVVKQTPDFVKTFSHEFSHTVVCCLFFKKVTTFNVRERSGEIYHTLGGPISKPCISLAPYCLPVATYLLLLFRAGLRPDVAWVADLLIGFVTAFYIHCFKDDIRPDQTDINQYRPMLFPYWFIYTFLAFNLSVLLFSILPGENVFSAYGHLFSSYGQRVWNLLSALFHL